MQTQGLLQESSLASLLQTMQAERATGALALESASDTASLYFLFGHLFHAAGPAGQGEDVVVDALTWRDGSFRFDPRAKLPPEETIKASPAELIAEAERRGPAEPQAGPEAQAAWDGSAGYAPGEPYPAVYGESAGYAETGWTAPEPERPQVDQQAAAYAGWGAPVPEPVVPAPAYLPPAHYPPPEPRPAPAPVVYRQEPPAPVRAPQREEAPPPAPAAPAAPVAPPVPAAPATVRAPAVPVAAPAPLLGALGAVALDMVYPLPAGQAQYEGLKSAFVDFPKLLRTLRGDQHTGYVRLTAPDFSGVLLFQQGHLLEALSNIPGAPAGEMAFQAMRRCMDAGTGSLDVIDLAGETVDALAQLLSAPLLYTGLLGRFVNFDALLAYLAEENVEGAVLVVGSSDVGIILLTHGKVLGAYTKGTPTLSTATTGVAKVAAEKSARIEVKSGAGTISAIDVEIALSRAY